MKCLKKNIIISRVVPIVVEKNEHIFSHKRAHVAICKLNFSAFLCICSLFDEHLHFIFFSKSRDFVMIFIHK